MDLKEHKVVVVVAAILTLRHHRNLVHGHKADSNTSVECQNTAGNTILDTFQVDCPRANKRV